MKKTMAIFLVVIISVSMLVGCGGGQTGKYYLKSMTMMGVEMPIEALAAFGIDASKMYLELRSGGKFVMSMEGFGEEAQKEGTYTINGKTITLTADGETVTGTIEGKKITISQEGEKVVFEKK